MDFHIKDKRISLITLCCIGWGILAHGMAIFNKYSYHDDVPWFNGVGETYGLGRWFLGFSGKMIEWLFDSHNYSMPVFNGVLTIASIGTMVYIMCKKLDINSDILIVSLCGVMICFPSVINIFGFVFTAGYYYISALMSVVGAYIFYKFKSIPSIIICAFLMALSTGIYQSNIAISLIVMLIFMLDEVAGSDMDWKQYMILTGKNAVICICFMAEYFVLNRVFLTLNHQEMYDYKGVNSFGATDIRGYLLRVVTAYKRFIKPVDYINYNNASANMFPFNIRYLHMILVFLVVILIAFWLKDIPGMAKKVQIGLLVIISPLFSYFIYVMVAEEDAHGGMAYGEAFMFVLAVFVIEKMREKNRYTQIISRVCVALIFAIGIMMARYANVCYLKAEIMQNEAINYYNRLIVRIQSTDGYSEDTPVVYVGGRSKNDDDLQGAKIFDTIYLPPYQGNSIINDFSWEETMNMWCGFSRVEGSMSDIEDKSVVDAMPLYPAEGSIRMVDDVLVVKFAE